MGVIDNWPRLAEALTAIGAEFVGEYRAELLASSFSQAGETADTLAPEVVEDATGLHLVIGLAGWWYYVEHGRGPGKMPPRDRILEWINTTGLTPEPDENGNTISLDTLAFLIARKIGREGTKGKNVVFKVMERNAERWAEQINIAARQDVRARVIKIFGKLKV